LRKSVVPAWAKIIQDQTGNGVILTRRQQRGKEKNQKANPNRIKRLAASWRCPD
jgi:hypothetical protein